MELVKNFECDLYATNTPKESEKIEKFKSVDCSIHYKVPRIAVVSGEYIEAILSVPYFNISHEQFTIS